MRRFRRSIIVSPRRGKDNLPLAETDFDFLMSDVLVDYSTYAPCVLRSSRLPSIDDYDEIKLHCLLSTALCMLQS